MGHLRLLPGVGLVDLSSPDLPGRLAGKVSDQLARRLILDTIEKQRVAPGTLVIHADRGSSMKSKPVALLRADLGVTKSHSRPHVCLTTVTPSRSSGP